MLLSAAMLSAQGGAAGGTQSLSFYNIHTKETTAIEFKRDGQYLPGALEKFNWVFRDWRKNEPTRMDPALLDLLWEIHNELGSKQPIHIISGYRSKSTNENLRATVGGQASESRHILGKAADVHFPDVPLRALRYSALIREKGGVGFYPTSAIEFVHVDTDRVRHWPRLPRHELALLFPDGHSKHQPADGGPITLDDVRTARSQHRDLSKQIAAFFDSRMGKRPPIAVAGLDPAFSPPNAGTQVAVLTPQPPVPSPTSAPRPAGQQVAAVDPPKLVEAPRLADRPSRFTPPAANDQARLSELIRNASFTPPVPKLLAPPIPAIRPNTGAPKTAAAPSRTAELSAAATVAVQQAPDFDDDHPEELSYRPFPIAPLMTLTASADDPALAILSHPDAARALEWLDQGGAAPSLRFRAGTQVAEAMMTQQFQGDAVNLSAWSEATDGAQTGLPSRRVKTR